VLVLAVKADCVDSFAFAEFVGKNCSVENFRQILGFFEYILETVFFLSFLGIPFLLEARRFVIGLELGPFSQQGIVIMMIMIAAFGGVSCWLNVLISQLC